MFCFEMHGSFEGPFETKEEAIEAAFEYHEDYEPEAVNIGVVVPIDFEEVASKIIGKIDFSEMMRDEIEELIGDEFDPDNFNLAAFEDKIQPHLTDLLREAYGRFWQVGETETVTR